jgi:hypothetical protein
VAPFLSVASVPERLSPIHPVGHCAISQKPKAKSQPRFLCSLPNAKFHCLRTQSCLASASGRHLLLSFFYSSSSAERDLRAASTAHRQHSEPETATAHRYKPLTGSHAFFPQEHPAYSAFYTKTTPWKKNHPYYRLIF